MRDLISQEKLSWENKFQDDMFALTTVYREVYMSSGHIHLSYKNHAAHSLQRSITLLP